MEHNIIWHKQPKFVAEIIDHAEHLHAEFPNADFLGIGQSPAWLLRTVCLIGRAEAKQQGRRMKARINVIPFSSHFVKKAPSAAGLDFKEHTDRVDGQTIKTFEIDTPKNVYLYRKRLKERAQSPKCIIDNFKRSGRPTVIMDYTHNARGLASFMHLMCAWAKEDGEDVLKEFLEASRVHALVEFGGIDAMRFPDLDLTIPVTKRLVSDKFTFYFADAPNDAVDRLVRYYPAEKWREPAGGIISKPCTSEFGSALADAVYKRLGVQGVSNEPKATRPKAAAKPNPLTP